MRNKEEKNLPLLKCYLYRVTDNEIHVVNNVQIAHSSKFASTDFFLRRSVLALMLVRDQTTRKN